MSNLSDLVEEAAKRYGLSNRSGFLRRTMQIESSGNPSATNGPAKGLFQFMPSTWDTYARGKDPFDPATNIDAAARLTRDNADALRKALGREPTDAELYIAHNQGAGGASRMLTDGAQRAGSTVGDSAVANNFGGDPNMTNAAYAARIMAKFNNTKPSATEGTPTGTATDPGLPQLQSAADEALAKQKAAADAFQKMMASKPAVDGTKLSSGGAILQGLSDAWDAKRAAAKIAGPAPAAAPPPGPGNQGMGGTAATGAMTDAAMGNADQGDWKVPGAEKPDPLKLLSSKLASIFGVA